ncbi:MAG: hypothetical protein RBG13Loki_0479 [Promethearchaeota archaeon CR_4]|nr:MAG: hypothetical protein RBG13Loki_0479 [Candidatus Lokiarchaeota archaeon CR_4]
MKVLYMCPVCKKNHEVLLDTKIIEKQGSFPFPYFDLHGDLRDILSLLYIDANLKVRGVEAKQLVEANIFSQDFASSITQTLMNEISRLEEENKKLREELVRLKK